MTLRGRLGAQQRAARAAPSNSLRALKRSSGTPSHWVYTRPGSSTAEGLVTICENRRVETIFVSPCEQGHGAGSELMEQAKFGRLQLEAQVLEENLRGRYFLQQHGFLETGRWFNQAANQDEILMCCRVA